jgi:hypothetical protein
MGRQWRTTAGGEKAHRAGDEAAAAASISQLWQHPGGRRRTRCQGGRGDGAVHRRAIFTRRREIVKGGLGRWPALFKGGGWRCGAGGRSGVVPRSEEVEEGPDR